MKVEIRAERLREEITRSERRPRQKFEPDLKRRLVEYAQERNDESGSYVAIGRELGIPRTIADWLGRAAKKVKREGFRRIEVREPARTVSLVVVHSSGVRIEGLDLAGVADLLRRLA